jgi:thioredoxin-related protein
LQSAVVRERLSGFDVVQLTLLDDATPVLTTDGRRLAPRRWAERLQLFYTPTLVVFDVNGQEIFRIDSVVQLFRLAGVLRYVQEKAYQDHPIFQHWKFSQSKSEQEALSQDPPQHVP